MRYSERPARLYDPLQPWGGVRGSPCGNPVDLADCRECGMCGGCLAHNDCLTDFAHLAWYAAFASPGEAACGAAGTIAGRRFTCELKRRHGGDLHRDKMGNGWGISRLASRAWP